MKNLEKLSDIESLLASQTWKSRKLPSINLKKRNFTVIETENCKEYNQIILNNSQSLQSPIITENHSKSKASLALLSVPFPAITNAITSFASKKRSIDLQVPAFPKNHFGHSTKSLSILPKFKTLSIDTPSNYIRDVKIEYGRIIKSNRGYEKKSFEFLSDYNQIENEKILKNIRTLSLKS